MVGEIYEMENWLFCGIILNLSSKSMKLLMEEWIRKDIKQYQIVQLKTDSNISRASYLPL